MFIRLSELLHTEAEEIKEMVDQMNREATVESKPPVFLRFKDYQDGSIAILLNKDRGPEGLDLLWIVLHRLKRYRSDQSPKGGRAA